MKNRLPTPDEIDELVSYLPRLYAEGFKPVKVWEGGNRDSNGNITLPWPEYDEVVMEFFRVTAKDCWLDYDYIPEKAAQMIKDNDFIKVASLPEIKTMLTYCVRGERFSDGHWETMIEGLYIYRLLERLVEIKQLDN